MNGRLQWMPAISRRIVLVERNRQTYPEFEWKRKGHRTNFSRQDLNKTPQTDATNGLKAVSNRCVIFCNLIIAFKFVRRVLKEI